MMFTWASMCRRSNNGFFLLLGGQFQSTLVCFLWTLGTSGTNICLGPKERKRDRSGRKSLCPWSSFDRYFLNWPLVNIERTTRAESCDKMTLSATERVELWIGFQLKVIIDEQKHKNFRIKSKFRLHSLAQLPFEPILWITYLSKSFYTLVVLSSESIFPYKQCSTRWLGRCPNEPLTLAHPIT